MTTVREFFKIAGDDKYLTYEPYLDYASLTCLDELKVVASEDVGYYSGKTFRLLKRLSDGLYAFAVHHYGSCSGCDDLQSVRDSGHYTSLEERLEALENLRADLLCDLEWKPLAQAVEDALTAVQRATDEDWDDKPEEFAAAVQALLAQAS